MKNNYNKSKTNDYNIVEKVISEYISSFKKNKKNNPKTCPKYLKSVTIISIIISFISIIINVVLFSASNTYKIFGLFSISIFIAFLLISIVFIIFSLCYIIKEHRDKNIPVNLLDILDKYNIDSQNNQILVEMVNYIKKHKIKSSVFYVFNSILDTLYHKIFNVIFSFSIFTNLISFLQLLEKTKSTKLNDYIFLAFFDIILLYLLLFSILNCISIFDNTYKYRRMIADIDKIKIRNICIKKNKKHLYQKK